MNKRKKTNCRRRNKNTFLTGLGREIANILLIKHTTGIKVETKSIVLG